MTDLGAVPRLVAAAAVVVLATRGAAADVPDAQSPTRLAQFQGDGRTPISVGGTATSSAIVLKAMVHAATAAQIKLLVEIRPISQALTGSVTHAAPAWMINGGVSSVLVTGLKPGQKYHWQAQTVADCNCISRWVEFGDNPATDSDLESDLTPPVAAGAGRPDR